MSVYQIALVGIPCSKSVELKNRCDCQNMNKLVIDITLITNAMVQDSL